MRVLITGGAGFIGSHLVEAWENDAEVVVLDNLRSGYRHNLNGRKCEFVEGDVGDRDLVVRLTENADFVFHLAAMVSVPESVREPDECVRNNVNGTLNVLHAAAKHGVKKVVFASSAAVYGDNPDVPKTEDMLPEPLSPYAVTKLDGEHYIRFYNHQFGLAGVALRFFNVFGPRQDPNGAYAAAVPIFIKRAFANEDIVIFGDGKQTRDFVYVKDIVGAMRFVAESGDAKGVFNVGYGGTLSINELAREVKRFSGSSSRIIHQKERPGDVRHSSASAKKLCSLGWLPHHNLESGLAQTLDHFRGD